MQAYHRYFEYLDQYFRLVYDYYSKDGACCLCNYFNIKFDQSIYDGEVLENGPYRYYGKEHSGIQFNLILLLPVYYVDSFQAQFIGDERGYIHEVTGSITFPSSYGLTPYEHDLVQFVLTPSTLAEHLQSSTDLSSLSKLPTLYEVTGIEISNDFPQETFIKCNIKSARTNIEQIASQITSFHTWYEPTKQILPVENALKLYNISEKAQAIINTFFDRYYDKRTACPIICASD